MVEFGIVAELSTLQWGRGIPLQRRCLSDVLRASMGPRSRDRGIEFNAGFMSQRLALQCGIAIEIPRASRTRALQWGRGHVTAESHCTGGRPQSGRPASMGP